MGKARSARALAAALGLLGFMVLAACSRPATVEFLTDPAGATVVVDGEPRGVTPLKLTLVRSRPYAVELRLAGHAPVRVIGRAFSGDDVVRASLVPALDVVDVTVALAAEAVYGAADGVRPDVPHVRLRFGRAPNPESVLDALAVVPAGPGAVVPGVATVSDDGVVWVPGRPLPAGEYLLLLGAGARAADGSPTAEPFRLPFTVPEMEDARVGLEVAGIFLSRGFSVSWTEYDGTSARLGPLGRTDLGKGLTRFTGELTPDGDARLTVVWDGGNIEAVRAGARVAARYADGVDPPGPWTWFDLDAPAPAYRDVARQLGSAVAGAVTVPVLPPGVPAEWGFLELLGRIAAARLEGILPGPEGAVHVVGLTVAGWNPGDRPGGGPAGSGAWLDPAGTPLPGTRYAGYRAEAWLLDGRTLVALRWQQYYVPTGDARGPVHFRFGEARFGPAPDAVAAPVDPRAAAGVDPVLASLHGFYQARLARNPSRVLGWLARDLRAEVEAEGGVAFIGPSNPHYGAYQVVGWEEFPDGTAVAGVNMVSKYAGEPLSALGREQVTLRREGGRWLVAGVDGDPEAWWTVLEDRGALWVKPRGDAPARKLVALADFPTDAEVPAGTGPAGAAPGTRFGVGRDAFGPVAPAPDGVTLAGFTRGMHSVLFTVDIESGRLRLLDLYFEGGGLDLRWSPDSRWLAVRVAEPSGATGARLYHVPSGTPVDLGLGALRPSGGPPVDVAWLAWSGTGYTLDLDAGLHEQPAAPWRFDLRTGQLGPRPTD